MWWHAPIISALGRQIFYAHWPASLAYLESSRPVRELVSKNKMNSTQRMTAEVAFWNTRTDTHTQDTQDLLCFYHGIKAQVLSLVQECIYEVPSNFNDYNFCLRCYFINAIALSTNDGSGEARLKSMSMQHSYHTTSWPLPSIPIAPHTQVPYAKAHGFTCNLHTSSCIL